jgi:hypothetical protein
MSEVIKFPSSDLFQKAESPRTPLISLMKANSFSEYNKQFLITRQIIWRNSDELEAENKGNIQRAVDFLNRDNAEIPIKNRLIIAHKMPDGENQTME